MHPTAEKATPNSLQPDPAPSCDSLQMNCNERRLARLVAGVFSLALALVPVALAQT